jgi:hypothetical protein
MESERITYAIDDVSDIKRRLEILENRKNSAGTFFICILKPEMDIVPFVLRWMDDDRVRNSHFWFKNDFTTKDKVINTYNAAVHQLSPAGDFLAWLNDSVDKSNMANTPYPPFDHTSINNLTELVMVVLARLRCLHILQ